MSEGTRVGGRYEVVRKVDEGGMGVVYEARHLLSKQRVALKVLHAHVARDQVSRERFLREVSAPAEIGHPGICQVYDAGFDGEDGAPFVALEFLDGVSLRRRLELGLAPQDALGFVEELLEALAAAHARGFVHRDLKPENVFIARQANGAEHVKLLDFGIARQTTEASDVTRTGTAIGTPHYMSPEQSMDTKNVRAPTDVWSVGVMLYEILSGRRPFDGETANAVVVHVCMTAHPPLLSVRPDVPPPLATLVERCLSKEIARRPQDAGELLRELRAARAQSAVPASSSPRTLLSQDHGGMPGGVAHAAPRMDTPGTQLLAAGMTPMSQPGYASSAHAAQGTAAVPGPAMTTPFPPQHGLAPQHSVPGMSQGVPMAYPHASGDAFAAPRKSGLPWAIGALIVVAILAGGGGVYLGTRDDDEPAPPRVDTRPAAAEDPPAPTPAALPYFLHVDSQPQGASVLVEGRTVITPGELTLGAPPTSPLTLSASLQGYVTRTVMVQPTDFVPVGDQMRANVTVMLQASPQVAQPEPVPPQPVQAQGGGTPVAPPAAQPDPDELTQAEATRLVTGHYNRRGEWAGQYRLVRVERMRMVREAPDRVQAHTRYAYRCVIDGCGGTMQSGTDQRVFTLQRGPSGWFVTRMGGHMSASM